jgi:hypothetical protein
MGHALLLRFIEHAVLCVPDSRTREGDFASIDALYGSPSPFLTGERFPEMWVRFFIPCTLNDP